MVNMKNLITIKSNCNQEKAKAFTLPAQYSDKRNVSQLLPELKSDKK